MMVDYTKWYMSNNTGRYNNVDSIELDLYFTGDLGMDLYYVVYKDGSEVYRSSRFNVPSYFAEAPYCRNQNAKMDGDYLEAGSYTIAFYSADDDMSIASDTATVTVTRATPTPTPAPQTDYPQRTEYYNVYKTDFADIKELKWYQYDSDKGQLKEDGKGVYYKGVKTLAFSIKIEGEGPELYYAYYYLGDDPDTIDMSTVDFTNPDYSNTVTPKTYNDGSFYDIDYKPDKVKPGYYYVIIGSDKAMALLDTYVAAICEVLDEKAPK